MEKSSAKEKHHEKLLTGMKMNRTYKLDSIDINILSQLQRNGKVSNIILSDLVGLSPSPCLKRVKRLEQLGYIQSYHAHVDLTKIAEITMVFTEVTLDIHTQESFRNFEMDLQACPELVECHAISGGLDYICKFVVKNITHYQFIIDNLLDKNRFIKHYYSYVVTHSPINKSLDIKHLL